MSVALMRSLAGIHAVRPQCQKLITSARTEAVRRHMRNTNTTLFATKNRTNQMSSVMVVLSQALHPCTVCLRTFLQALEKAWLDGKRRPKRQQLPLPESRSAVPFSRLHAPQTWPGDWAGDKKFANATVHLTVEQTLTTASTDLQKQRRAYKTPKASWKARCC